MTRSVLLLFVVLLAASCGGEDEKGTCSEECAGETPHCAADLDRCVPCLEDEHCALGELCVSTTGGAVCGECRSESDCGGGHCLEGACIECTVSTEAADCGDFACDPVARECTATERGSLARLEPCRADSECQADYGYACVMTRYDGEDDGTHCLKATSEGCSAPLTTSTDARVSVSWAPEQTYCGFNEGAVSAEAVRAMLESRDCASADDTVTCGPGGLCRDLVGTSFKCTIPCGVPEECPSGGAAAGCSPADHCGNPGA